MITLQHSLVTLCGLNGDEKKFEEQIPFVLIPDAIRRYCGPRPYSHFEENPDGSQISYMHFPGDLKTVSRENIGNEMMFLAEGYIPCVIGETTHIEKFEQVNGDLDPLYFTGVKKHLTQDVIFDDFVREGMGLDCSRRFESMYSPEETTGKNIGIYTFYRPVKDEDGNYVRTEDGKIKREPEVLDGEQVRKLIAEIENHGVYILAYLVEKSYGITANQEWFDRHVKTALDREYSQDLADGTYQYMRIPEEINRRITEHNWKHLEDGPIPLEDYARMYKDVVLQMPAIDAQMDEKISAQQGNDDKLIDE